MSNGPGGRGGRGGRGGGRLGSRTFQGRDGRGGVDSRDKSDGDRFPSTIDTWNPPGSQDTGGKPAKMGKFVFVSTMVLAVKWISV